MKMFDYEMHETANFVDAYYLVFESDEDAKEWQNGEMPDANLTGLEWVEEGVYCYDEYNGEWLNSMQVISRSGCYARMRSFCKSGIGRE